MNILLTGLLVFFIFLLILILKSYSLPPQPSILKNDSPHLSLPENIFISDARSYAFYTSNISQRNIFQPVRPSSPQIMPTEAPSVGVAPAGEWQKAFVVVGIMMGKTKEVIVKDIEQNETLLLREGDTLKGATIQEIHNDQIILTDADGNRIKFDYK